MKLKICFLEENMKFDEDCEVIWHDRKRFLGMPLSFTRYYLVKKGNEWIKIFRHKGLLSSLIDEVNLYRCFDLRLHASLVDKIVGTGTILVDSNDSAMPEFSLFHTKCATCFLHVLKLKERNAVLESPSSKLHSDKLEGTAFANFAWAEHNFYFNRFF